MSGTSTKFSAIYAFGDSLSDAGNVSTLTSLVGEEPVSPPYYTQTYGSSSASVFSNGPVWVQDLSVSLGLNILKPSLLGGTDYAYGGAETGSTPQNSGEAETLALSLPAQLTQFSANVGHAASTALFTLSVGGNDILDILANTSLSSSQQLTDVADAVNNEMSAINTMSQDGMKNLVVLNVPNLGLIPQVTFGDANGTDTPSASADALASSLASTYNSELAADLATQATKDGYSYNVVDTYSLITNAVADPSAYGYTNVTSPTYSGSFTSYVASALTSTNPAVQDQNLFWDHIHPTESGQNSIANLAEAAVSPSNVYELDLTTNVSSVQTAVAYEGQDTSLNSEFTATTPDNVALFASTANTFLQSGAGNDVLVAQSGSNVLSPGGGSNFVVGATGTGTDSIYISATGSTSTWNAILNFHAGDMLSVVGYTPGVSAVVWTEGPNNDGATLNINVAGSGNVWSSDTFLNVSLASAEKYAVTTQSGSPGVYTLTGV